MTIISVYIKDIKAKLIRLVTSRISIVLAESALEIIPTELRNNHIIINHSKKVGKSVGEVFLDKSYHYSAMKQKNIDFIWKRGRPDLVHICLLSILSTPLLYKNYFCNRWISEWSFFSKYTREISNDIFYCK